MKHGFNLLFLFLLIPTFHFAKGAKKIAQRHDNYVNANWKGFDSLVFTYKVDTLQTGLTSVKGNVNNGWDYQFKYTTQYSTSNKIVEQIRENGSGTTWVNANRYQYTYDANDNNTLVTYDVWNGTTWYPTSKIVYTGFNASGMAAKEEVFNWNGSNWMNASYILSTYVNNATKLQSSEAYIWNASTSNFDKDVRIYYNYNQDSVSIKTSSYPDTNNQWTSTNRILYNYNSNPFRLNEYVEQKMDTATLMWQNDKRIVYNYGTNNLIEKTSSQSYSSASVWDSTKKSQYIYDVNDMLIEYFDEINNGNWANSKRKTYTYLGSNVNEELQYLGNGNSWNLDRKINYSYDANDDVIFKQTNQFNGTYLPLSRDFYYYINGPLSLNQNISFVTGIKVFPNPATDMFYIHLKSNQSFNGVVNIFGLNGHLIKQITQPMLKGDNIISTSTSGLPIGNYLIQLGDEKGVHLISEKLAIIKY